MNTPVTVLIRNYNGKELLEQLLPNLLNVVANRGCADEVLIVDDGSVDGSCNYIKTDFPSVRLERIVPNSGNSIAPVNVGMKAARNPIVVCLDNDVLVKDDFLTPLISHFHRSDVFAVCPKIINPNHGNTVESVNYPFFRRGRLVGIVPGNFKNVELPEKPTFVWYAPGNGAAYDRAKYLELGGLDDLYRPIYSEDVDLCHRAWKQGWKTIYEPSACTLHLKHKTTAKHLKKRRHFEMYRNKNAFLFTWKNLQDREMLNKHIMWIFPHFFKALAVCDIGYTMGLILALAQIKEVLRKRRKTAFAGRYADKMIFAQLYPLHLQFRFLTAD